MKFIVLGATGGTGLEIVRQAIDHGHSVTAFVRSPERLKPFDHRIAIRQGDLLNSAELAKAINGHDAILSGFGPRVAHRERGRQPSAELRHRPDNRHARCQRPPRRDRFYSFPVQRFHRAANLPLRPPAFPGRSHRRSRNGADRHGKRPRLDHRAPPATHRQAIHRKVSYPDRPPPAFRLQHLTRRCSSFLPQDRRRPRLHQKDRRRKQLTSPSSRRSLLFTTPSPNAIACILSAAKNPRISLFALAFGTNRAGCE